MKVKRSKVIQEFVSAELTGADILRMTGSETGPGRAINVRVFVRVPAGGDYSGCDLEINAECPIHVEYEKEEKSNA